MKTLTLSDIPESAAYSDVLLKLSPGLYARVKVERDEDMGPPWEEHDGHGPVSKPAYHAFGQGTKPPKKAGERVLSWDRGYYRLYDFAAAMKQAKAEGWGLGSDDLAKLAAKLGRAPTAGEVTAEAVERDFDYLRGWVADEWQWVGVTVTLEDMDGAELASDSLTGFESRGDYWRETAADLVNGLLERHAAEQTERAYWEARDMVTA